MGEEVGEIDYDADAELKLGATYPEGEDVAKRIIMYSANGRRSNRR